MKLEEVFKDRRGRLFWMISNLGGEDRTLYTIHPSMRRKSVCPQELFPRTPLGLELTLNVLGIGPEKVANQRAQASRQYERQ